MLLGVGYGAGGDRDGFSQLCASGFMMAAEWVTLQCGHIWLRLGSGGMRAISVLGRVRSSGKVLIGPLGGEAVNSGIGMGRPGTGPSFHRFSASGFSVAVELVIASMSPFLF